VPSPYLYCDACKKPGKLPPSDGKPRPRYRCSKCNEYLRIITGPILPTVVSEKTNTLASADSPKPTPVAHSVVNVAAVPQIVATVPPPIAEPSNEPATATHYSSAPVSINVPVGSTPRKRISWRIYAWLAGVGGIIVLLLMFQFAMGRRSLPDSFASTQSLGIPFFGEPKIVQTFRFPYRVVSILWKPDNLHLVVGGGIEFENQSQGAVRGLLQALVPIHETPNRSEGFLAVANLGSGETTKTRKVPFLVMCVVGSPDSKKIAFAGMSNQIHLVDPSTLKTTRSFQLEGASECNALQFSTDGKRIVAGGSNGDAWLISIESGQTTHLPSIHKNVGAKGPSRLVAVNPSEDQVVYGSSTLTTSWNLKQNDFGAPSSSGRFTPILWSADGSKAIAMKEAPGSYGGANAIVSGSGDKPILIEESLHRNVGRTQYERFLQFHPKNSRVYGEIAYRGVLASWSEQSGALESESQAAIGWVNDMKLSPDGKLVATTDDFALRIWQHDGSSLKQTKVPNELFHRLAFAATEPYFLANASQPEKLLDQEDLKWCFQSGDAGLAMICEAIGGLDLARESLSSQSSDWMGNAVGLGAFVAEHTSKEAGALAFNPFDDLPNNESAKEAAGVMAANAIQQWRQLQASAERYREMRPRIWRRLLNYLPPNPAKLTLDENSFSIEFHDMPGSLDIDVWAGGGIGSHNPNEDRRVKIVGRYLGNQTLNNVILKFDGVRGETRGGGGDPQVYYVPVLAPGAELNLSGLVSIGISQAERSKGTVTPFNVKMRLYCDQGNVPSKEFVVPLNVPDEKRENMASLSKSLAPNSVIEGRWKNPISSGKISFLSSSLTFDAPYSMRFSGTTTRDDGAWTKSTFQGYIDPQENKAYLVIYRVFLQQRNYSSSEKAHMVVVLRMEKGKWVGNDKFGTEYEFDLSSP